MSNNPLLETHTLPPFSEINAAHIVPAVKSLTENNLDILEKQLAQCQQVSWENLLMPLEAREDALSQSWSPVSHLNLVCNTSEWRNAYEQALALLSPYYTALGQHKKLFEAYRALKESTEYDGYSRARKSAVEHALRDFTLSGIDLPAAQQKRYGDIQARLSQLGSQVSNNILDATQAWYFHTEQAEALKGLPEAIIAGAKVAAEQKNKTGYVLTLDGPIYIAVVTYADNQTLRETFYEAYCTRASDQGPNAGKWDNANLIEETLALRQELAVLLGFNNYTELSLATKMAATSHEVISFLQNIVDKAKPAAEKDLSALLAWTEKHFNKATLEPWDIPYYSEKLRQEKYDVSQEVLRQYFTLPKVLTGLFDVASKLFGIQIEERQKDNLWHQDARYFEISRHGEKIAAFYMDLYAREGKRGGAWMDVCRTRRLTPHGLQLPVAYLICNFNPPLPDQVATLTHNDVTTLFHEFGHGLHHMLTKIDVAAVSGIGGVAWDAVELPSQFLENWCWQPEVLKSISSHIDSGAPLSDTLIEKMMAAKNFQSGLFLVRQIEFSLFDMRLHQDFSTDGFLGVQGTLESVRKQVAVIQPPSYNRFQNSFSHIFAGGYAAGYYSYLWAEVLSADAFSAFEEEGIFHQETGQRFLDEILSQGGSDSAANLFKRFRGRAFEVDALLRHRGIES